MPVPVLRRESHHRVRLGSEPLRELEQIQEQTFQLLASALGANPFGSGGIWVPAVDIEENEDPWTIGAELPGAKGR